MPGIGPTRAAAGMIGRLYPPFRRARRTGLTTFVFHDVGTGPSDFAREHNLCVSPELFRRQAIWIARHYTVIHPDDLLGRGIACENAALITFDDGWAGTFEHALPILGELGLPSIVFLNCGAIGGEPFVAAAAAFLGRDPGFARFAAARGLSQPFHLTLNPTLLDAFEKERGSASLDGIGAYQGRLATWETVTSWDGRSDVRFGNHLYNHWNAAALTPEELLSFYRRNEAWLDRLAGARPIFAFPNGQPGSCFGPADVAMLREAGARRLFAASGGISADRGASLLDRVALTGVHDVAAAMWYAVARKTLMHSIRS